MWGQENLERHINWVLYTYPFTNFDYVNHISFPSLLANLTFELSLSLKPKLQICLRLVVDSKPCKTIGDKNSVTYSAWLTFLLRRILGSIM